MGKKEDNQILLGIGVVAAAYFLINRIGSALGIQTKEEKQEEIQRELDTGTQYVVTRTRTVNGKRQTYQINLLTLARQLYEDMGGNNYLGINYSFIKTSEPVDTLKKVAPMDMRTVAMLYNRTFSRNLKEDLLRRLWESDIEDPTVQAYLNAF